jgi:hypothetical protein
MLEAGNICGLIVFLPFRLLQKLTDRS